MTLTSRTSRPTQRTSTNLLVVGHLVTYAVQGTYKNTPSGVFLFYLPACYNPGVKLTSLGIVATALLALLPFLTSRHLFHAAVNVKYFFIITTILVGACIVANMLWQGKHSFTIKNRPLLWTGLGILAAYWVSALLGVYPERSIFSDIFRSSGVFFLTHIAVFALMLGEFLNERDWSVLRRTTVLSSAVFSFFTLLGAEGLGISGRLLWTNLDISGFTFGNSTFAGTYLVLALMIALIELIRTPARTRWWYTTLISGVLIFFSPILFNLGALASLEVPIGSARASSATAILLLIFLGGYWLIRKYGQRLRYALPTWGAVFVVVILGGVTLLFTPGSVVQEQYIEASSAARIVVWQGGLEAFKERPVLGWGPDNFEQAFQQHFDNRLYQDEFIGEIWFDRAHNIIVDTLVEVGAVGAIALVVVAGAFVLVVYRARRRGVIGEPEAMILFALPLAHFLQLQTGFDTVGSYTLLAVLGGYGLWLERTAQAQETNKKHRAPAAPLYYKAGATALVALVLTSGYMTLGEYNRQSALYKIFIETSGQKQLALAEEATSRLSSFESLRLASASLLRATFAQLAEGKMSNESAARALAQLHVYEERLRTYVEEQPEYYRARLNLAYLLSIESVLGEKKLDEAQAVLTPAYELAPANPLTYSVDALIELYSGNLTAAREKAQAGVALNPNVSMSKEVLAHIEKQARTFPEVSVLRLENL